MRLNPDFFSDQEDDDDDDFLDSKIKTIESFDDLPEDVQESLASIKKKIRSMSDQSKDDLLEFVAFQQLQISLLQNEITTIHKLLLMLSASVDEVRDGKED
jgi:hypothetical protein|tara:strand:- start:297 stop:599 length:303 start_codon:yes stop_codon:yes gene_type:complete